VLQLRSVGPSSSPWEPSLALKNSMGHTFVKLQGWELIRPLALRSFTSLVPARVPSLRHSSEPWMRSSALKYSVPPTLVCEAGRELPEGLMSLTSYVLAASETAGDVSSNPRASGIARSTAICRACIRLAGISKAPLPCVPDPPLDGERSRPRRMPALPPMTGRSVGRYRQRSDAGASTATLPLSMYHYLRCGTAFPCLIRHAWPELRPVAFWI
jgi:hypothetical protein